MDELTLLGEFRSDMPGPTTAETGAARDALLSAMQDVRSSSARATSSASRAAAGGRAARRFWISVGAVTCAAAVGVAAAAVLAPGRRATRPATKPAILTAAFALRQAASAAASQAGGHGRFFVSESEYIDPGNGQNAPAKRTIWIGNRVTGRLVQGGQGSAAIPAGISLGRRTITWKQLQNLPTAPGPLSAVIASASKNNGQPLVQAEFGTIVGLLFESPTPPELRSALYRAAARLPGVTLVPASHDLIGRAAAEVYVPPGFSGNGGAGSISCHPVPHEASSRSPGPAVPPAVRSRPAGSPPPLPRPAGRVSRPARHRRLVTQRLADRAGRAHGG